MKPKTIQVIYDGSFYSEAKWNTLVFSPNDIKAIDGITIKPNTLPSTVKDPNFPNNPYTLQGETGLTVSYVEGSRVNDDTKGSYTYSVALSKQGLDPKTVQIIYFFSTQKELAQRKWDSLAFSTDDIKAIDGITANPNLLPSKAEDPKFPRNPYTIKGEKGITVSYVAKSRVNDDVTGSYSYQVTLSKQGVNNAKTVQVIYFFATKLQIAQGKWDGLVFTAAHIKAIDGITPDPQTLPSRVVADPKFPRNPYTIKGEKGITVTYVRNSRVNDDKTGSYSYRVTLSKQGLKNQK